MMKNEDLIKKLESARLPEAELLTHQRLLKTALLKNYESPSNKTAEAVKRRRIPVMDTIKGVDRNKWLRPIVLSLSVVAVVAMLFILQPWTGNNGYTTLLAKAKEAAENIQSYCVDSSTTIVDIDNPDIEQVTTENIFEFVLPDLAHLTYSHSYNSTNNGVVTRVEESFEIYYDGEYQYFHSKDKESLLLSGGDLYYLYYGNGGTMSQEHAVAMLEFTDKQEQLDDEVIDGVTCLHYKGTAKIGNTEIEMWIGKNDYLIRQIKQVSQSDNYISTYVTSFYNFNADITIDVPLDDSGNLLPGWEKEVYELGFDIIPVEDAIASITGDEDWSDPAVIREVMELFSYSSDPIIFFNALPEEGQQAIINYFENITSYITVETSTKAVSYSFNDGVLHYSNTGAGLDVYVDTNGISGEGIVVDDVDGTLYRWLYTIKAEDPQAYFDAFSDQIKQEMVSALSIDGFHITLMSMLR
jgi:outer membrane lipoprotein-sorting protein